jgi:hypothetical protein
MAFRWLEFDVGWLLLLFFDFLCGFFNLGVGLKELFVGTEYRLLVKA